MRPLRLTDGGLETALVSGWGVELPFWTAFPLVTSPAGRAVLRDYWQPYLDLARRHGVGLDVGTPTWRAHADWATRLGHDADALRTTVRLASILARDLAERVPGGRAVGVMGPRRTGYALTGTKSGREAAAYHRPQAEAFAEGGVDLVSALALDHCAEAVGIVRVVTEVGLPVVVHLVVGADGRLPDGTAVHEAVATVDDLTGGIAAGFGICCADAARLRAVLPGGTWAERLVSLRLNASWMTHAALDGAGRFDHGVPDDLGRWTRDLVQRLPGLEVVGGCCGTDLGHVRAQADACLG